MATDTLPQINLLDPQFYVDPWEAYRWLRAHAPVFWDPVQRLWGISRHADIVDIEKQPDLYSSQPGSRPHLDQSADRSMINLDDPGHQHQRKVVVRRFTPRGVRDHEALVRALADTVIGEALEQDPGHVEVVDQIASRLPAMVVAELLGYQRDEWPLIRRVSELTMLSAGQTPADGGPFASQSPEAMDAFFEWVTRTLEIVAERRSAPRDDLLSLWCHSETDGVGWDDGRIVEEAILVVDGGAETTRTVIGAICRELAVRPEVQAKLRREPSLLGTTAVEEFIRWVSPVVNMRRTVTRDHQLGGHQLRRGDEVLLLYPSANRDERVYEHPDELDVERERNHHVAFGFGTHVCLGASLARLELRVTFEQLLARLPEWRLAPGTEPRIIPATFTRAYDAVHLALG